VRAKVGDGELTVVGCSPERPGTQGKSCRHAGARLERESSWGRPEGRDPSDPSVVEDNGADSQHFRADQVDMALAVLQNEGIPLGGSCWVDPLGSLVHLKDRLDMEDGVLVGSCLLVQGDVESFPEVEEVPRIRRAGTFRPARVDPEGRIPQALGDLQGDLDSQDEIHAAGMVLEVLRIVQVDVVDLGLDIQGTLDHSLDNLEALAVQVVCSCLVG